MAVLAAEPTARPANARSVRPPAPEVAPAREDAGTHVTPSPEAPAQDAPSRFAQGKRTIESNLGDSYGATRGGLEQGIAEVEEALRLGYPDKKAGHVLIGQAYQQILAYVPMGSPEQRAFRARAAEAYRAALELDRSDVEVRLHYAAMITDPSERTRQHQEAVRIAPDSGMARYMLAGDLIRAGNEAEGARQLVAAVERFTPPELNDYGWQAAAALRRLGFEREAAKVDERLKSIPKEPR